jgi:hypothetical protein
VPRPQPGAEARLTRTERRRQHVRSNGNRSALLVAALILAIGVAAMITIAVRRSDGGGSAGAAASPSIAAPPTFGASLPLTGPSRTSTSAGNAAFSAPAAVTEVLAAAKTAVQAVDSYDDRRLAASQAAGDAHSTGDFRSRYDTSLTGALATAARANKTVQQATVEKTAVASLAGAQATVLAFGRTDTVDATHPGGTVTTVTVGVTLQNVDGAWRISGMEDIGSSGTFPADPPGTAGLSAAVIAAAHEVVDLLSYTRNDFDADYARALDGLTTTLRTSQEAQRAPLKASMTAQQIDFAGSIRSVGVESASGTSVLMLVCATGYRIDNTGKTVAAGGLRFEIGVTYTGHRWLVSEYLALVSS